MLILADTNDKLQIVTSANVTVDVHASFIDSSTADPPVVKGSTSGKQNTAITTAATTDIVAAPAASTIRNVKTVNVRNKHASSSVDVTVVYDDNSTDFELHKATLRAGECLQYIEGIGWFLVAALTSPQLRTVKLGSDATSTSATLAEATGLSLTTGIGTFTFEYYLLCQTSVSTSGFSFAVNHTGTVTAWVFNTRWVTNISTASDDVADQDHVAAAAGVVSAFSSRAKSTTARGVITDLDTANLDTLFRVEGMGIVTVDGDIELWFNNEAAAGTVTVKAGSSLVLVRTGD
jgi:hypothetical protein